MKVLKLSAVLLLLVLAHATINAGEEKPAEPAKADPPLKVTMSGETLEGLEVKWSLTREWKRGTARELVEDYLVMFDDAKSESAFFASERKRFEDLSNKFIHDWRAKAIEEKYLAQLEKAQADKEAKRKQEDEERKKKENMPESKTHPARIVGEEDSGTGGVWVNLEAESESPTMDENGKWVSQKTTRKSRVLCMKNSDGTWGVEKHEVYEPSYKGDGGKDTMKWQERSKLKELMQFAGMNLSEISMPDTKEATKTAQFILDNFNGWEGLMVVFASFGKLTVNLVPLLKPLFTPESFKRTDEECKAAMAATKEKEAKEEKKPREVENTEKPDADTVVITFKPKEEKWGSKHIVKLKNTKDGWRAFEIMKIERKGEGWAEPKAIETFNDMGW